VISPVTIGQVVGFGGFGYILALTALINLEKEVV
jgi:3-dehydroquinate dehydratase